MKNKKYYLSKKMDDKAACYFTKGRRKIISVKPSEDYNLILTFDNGEIRRLNCYNLIEHGSNIDFFKDYNNFKRVYLDIDSVVCWDKDPNVDSSIVWNNKIDLCPDSCYIDSIPVENG